MYFMYFFLCCLIFLHEMSWMGSGGFTIYSDQTILTYWDWDTKVKFETGKIHYALYMIFLSFKTYTIGISRIKQISASENFVPTPFNPLFLDSILSNYTHTHTTSFLLGGGRVVRWCWVNFQCRGVLLIWIRVRQGLTTLAVGAGGGCLDIFSLVYHFSFLSPSLWETARYRLKYCLKGPLNPKQPTFLLNSHAVVLLSLLLRFLNITVTARCTLSLNLCAPEDWLVGCFGFNGPLRQYFSLYRAVSQRQGERGEKG